MDHPESQMKALEEGLITSTSSSDKSTTTKLVNTALSSTSTIAKLLPTGILYVFQVFTNLFSNDGECRKSNKILVGIALGVLGIACFVLSLVDSFTDSSTGKVHYGIATINGIATGGETKPSDESEYKIKLRDFAHAVVAVAVFGVMALTDQTVVQCLYPSEERNIRKLLQALPVAFSAASSVIFVLFPSNRNGVSSPSTTKS